MAPSLTEIGAAGEGAGRHRLRRAADGGDRARPVPAARDRGRAHGAHRARQPASPSPSPRTPMLTAYTANDLHRASEGRFILGLGSQIKPHIEKRFSMPWSHPAARMREYILAMRAIWAAWNDGEKLDFRGDFYQHTLMTPFFAPGPNPHGHAEGVPRRGRRADDRGRGRGRRRHHHPRLHDRAVRQGGHGAGDRARSGEGRAVARVASRSRVRCSSSPGATKRSSNERARARSSRSRSTDRHPRTAASSSCTAGAICRPSSTRSRSGASGSRWAT